jgi:hypothetical protein
MCENFFGNGSLLATRTSCHVIGPAVTISVAQKIPLLRGAQRGWNSAGVDYWDALRKEWHA